MTSGAPRFQPIRYVPVPPPESMPHVRQSRFQADTWLLTASLAFAVVTLILLGVRRELSQSADQRAADNISVDVSASTTPFLSADDTSTPRMADSDELGSTRGSDGAADIVAEPTSTMVGGHQEGSVPDVPKPPEELEIPRIGVDVPVILVDSDSLPEEPLAGWLYPSAFPSQAGNMVVLGHLNGDAGIFARLHELGPGDSIHVITGDYVFVYVVESSELVDAAAVQVLAPSSEPVLTLLTCAGDWNAWANSYDRRLVVRARYTPVN